MRSFKKVMALVLAVALTLSTFTVSFAAASEAGKLVDLGLLLKTDDLDNTLTRKVGIAVVLKALGYTQEDQDATELVNPFTDTEAWYGGFAAIAVDLGITNGVSETEFGGDLVLTQKMFVSFMLRALGYEVSAETYADDAALTALAVEAGIAEEIVNGEFTKGDAVEIMFAALSAEMQDGSGMTLIEVLVAAGEVTREAAVEAGLIDATPEELLVTSVETLDNLAQIQVNFNKPVADGYDDVANFDDSDDMNLIDGGIVEDDDATDDIDESEEDDAKFELSEDGMSVVITIKDAVVLAANDGDGVQSQDVDTIVISDVEAEDGDVLEEVEFDVEFMDTKIPVVESAEVIGIDTIKVTFSEPMTTASLSNEDNYEVDGGDIVVDDEFVVQNNNTEVLVTLLSDLDEQDEVTIEVSDVEDYAGYEALSKEFTIEVVEDTEAPVVTGYKDASLDEVTLIWSEDIESTNLDVEDLVTIDEVVDGETETYYYHTNTNNPAMEVEIDGNEMTITFDEDEEMPDGVVYVYVAAEQIQDYWENDNAKQVVKIETTADVAAPVFVSYDVDDQNTLVLTFDENVTAIDEATLFEDGEESDVDVDDITFADDEVTITFEEDIYGDFEIVLEDVEDENDNVADEITVAFTMEDTTSPDEEGDFSAVLYGLEDDDQMDQMIKVSFPEALATEGKYAVTDIEKWQVLAVDGEGTEWVSLADYEDDVTITVVDDGEAVEIEIAYDLDDEEGFIVATDDDVNEDTDADAETAEIRLARVADTDGNYTTGLTNEISVELEGTVGVETVEATAVNKVVVTFDDYLSKFSKVDFTITTGTGGTVAAGELEYSKVVTSTNDDGNTVVTFTLVDDLNYDASSVVLGDVSVVIAADADEDDIVSENKYGEKVLADEYAVADAITPALVDDFEDANGDEVDKVVATVVDGVYYITLTFTELIDATSVSDVSFEVDGVDVEAITLADEEADEDDQIVIELAADDDVTELEDLKGVNVTQTAKIKDAAGNSVSGIETEVADTFEE